MSARQRAQRCEITTAPKTKSVGSGFPHVDQTPTMKTSWEVIVGEPSPKRRWSWPVAIWVAALIVSIVGILVSLQGCAWGLSGHVGVEGPKDDPFFGTSSSTKLLPLQEECPHK